MEDRRGEEKKGTFFPPQTVTGLRVVWWTGKGFLLQEAPWHISQEDSTCQQEPRQGGNHGHVGWPAEACAGGGKGG